MKPISFKGVVLRIPVGEDIGKHYDGLAKVAQYPLYWQSGVAFGSEEFTLGACETLRESGYNVLGGANLLFDENDAAKATYQLGATIGGLRYNTFGSLAGNYNEAIVHVEWQLYDAFLKRVVYTDSTEGFAKMSPSTKPAVFSAFNNALRNLLADPAFVSMLKSDAEDASLRISSDIIRVLNNPSNRTTQLPEYTEEVMQAVVTVKVGQTIGSGFVVSPDGYVLTAAHVVSGVDDAPLVFSSGLTLTAAVLRVDNGQDVALLKLPGDGHNCLRLAVDSNPQPGSDVYAIGTPYSDELALTVTRGIVSGYRNLNGTPYLQTDASLNPGNSGGPLLNESGEVIGIVSWKIVAPGFEGLAFGVPVTAVEQALDIEFISVLSTEE